MEAGNCVKRNVPRTEHGVPTTDPDCSQNRDAIRSGGATMQIGMFRGVPQTGCILQMAYTLLRKHPVGVVGFFDSLWTDAQNECSASTMVDQIQPGSQLCIGIIRFFDFDYADLAQKVNMSPGCFSTKNNLTFTDKPL